MIGVAGCGGPARKKTEPVAPPPQEKPLPRIANTGPGEGTRFADSGPRRPVWTLRWKSARLEAIGQAKLAGTMSEVTGEVFREGKVVSTFSAKRAEASRETGILTLRDDVRVRSSDQKTVLTCGTLAWDADTETLRAAQDVTIEGDWGTFRPAGELWIAPDLSRLGSPDLFRQP